MIDGDEVAFALLRSRRALVRSHRFRAGGHEPRAAPVPPARGGAGAPGERGDGLGGCRVLSPRRHGGRVTKPTARGGESSPLLVSSAGGIASPVGWLPTVHPLLHLIIAPARPGTCSGWEYLGQWVSQVFPRDGQARI